MEEQTIAIIPIRGSDNEFSDGPNPLLGGRPLLAYTLLAAKAAKRLNRVIVTTDSPIIAEVCRGYDVELPFIRPEHLSKPSATATEVLRHCIEWLEAKERYRTDWVVKLEITHPFRPPGVIDLTVQTALAQGVDSAFLVHEEKGSYWTLGDTGQPEQVGQEVDVPRRIRKPFYRDLSGLATMTRASNLKSGRLYGRNVGLIPVRDLFAIVDTHEGANGHSYREWTGFRLAELLAPEFNKIVSWEERLT